MAVSSKHKGWLNKHNEGILAGVYNGAQGGTTLLGANTALDGVLLGTPVTPALAVDSLVFSNLVASGDILMAANAGGNSQAWLWIDSSAGTMRLYGAGTAVLETAATYAQVLDDILLGIGTGNTARFSYDTTDANANALLLQLPAGGATDVPVLAIGQSIESVDLGLFNGVVDPNIAIFGVGAVTTGPRLRSYKARGTIAAPTVVTSGDDLLSIDAYGAVAAGEYVQAARILFEMTGTIATTRGPGVITFQTATDAAPSVLTTAMTISAAQLVTVAAGLSLTTGNLTFAAASDIVAAANTAAALEVSDGTTKLIAFDTRNTVSGVNAITITPQAITLPNGAGSTLTGVKIAGVTHVLAGQTQVTTELDGVSLHVAAPTINQSGGAVTVDAAQTVYIAAAPTAGGSVTITNLYALRVDDGVSRLDGGVILGDTIANALVSQATSGSGTVTHYIGNQTVTTSSDSRVKTDIAEWQGDALSLLRRAETLKEFRYNLPGGGPQDSGYGPNARGKYLGFMAQETLKWAPWVVNAGAGADCQACLAGAPCDKHTPWTVEYQHLIPLVIKGVQEIDARLAALGV